MTDSHPLRPVRRFRPPLWAAALTAVLFAGMVALGIWQLDRAEEKQRMLSDFAAAEEMPAEALAAPAPAAGPTPRRVRVTGRYDDDTQLLLDNQLREGRAGLRVWTPLQRSGGGVILVDRGWIPDPGRGTLPDVTVADGARGLTGIWRPLPEAGIAVDNALCDDTGLQRAQYPSHAQLACRFDAPLARGLLLLDAGENDGFSRQWQPQHLEPRVHWGYALQWFAFAAALLVIFFVVNRKAE